MGSGAVPTVVSRGKGTFRGSGTKFPKADSNPLKFLTFPFKKSRGKQFGKVIGQSPGSVA